MGGWRADGSASAPPHKDPSPARRTFGRGESRDPRSSFRERRDLSVRWRDAMRPVKDAAALGRNGADALRDATLRFFADAEARGFPSAAELDTRELGSDVMTLVRAANGAGETPETELAARLARGVDALVAHLAATGAAAPDAEVVAVLCAYYAARLSRTRARGRDSREPPRTDVSRSNDDDDDDDARRAEEKDAADAHDAVAALARRFGASFPDAETEALVELAVADLRLFTRQDSKRRVLGALGAVASRVPASALSESAHARVGEALSRLLDDDDAAARRAGGPRAAGGDTLAASASVSGDGGFCLEETLVASRYYASLWRCAHLCASRDGARWPEPVVAGLAGRVRRFLSFGVDAATRRSADAAPAETPNPNASASGRGYVPPHARDADVADAASDSDASDAESSAGETPRGDRFGASRVRANAASFVASLARADPRGAHPFWPRLLPTSAAQFSRSPSTTRRGPCTLARAMLHDPSPRVRAAAAVAVAQLLDAPASRAYLSAAELKLDPTTGLALRRVNFASLSSTLGDLAVATHGALTLAIKAERSLACVPSACKAAAALADAAPFARLPRNLVPDAALAAWRRVSSLASSRARDASGGEGSEDPERVSAQVALLSALAATLGAEGAPARFRAALGGGGETDPGDGSVESAADSEPARDARDLREIIPGLASLAGDATVAVAVRCEAFGALRAAAATHAAAVAAHWCDARVQAALPGATCAPDEETDEKRLLSADERDRAAHASARFLAEYLLAAGGGGAAAALSASAGDEEPNAPAADAEAAARRRRGGGGGGGGAEPPRAFALPAEASVALWTSVAAVHFPAMAAHASPLVRASGLGALGGLTAQTLRGVSKAHRVLLTEAPRAAARSDDSANVRAAACRAVGAAASFYADADASAFFESEAETRASLRSDAALLVAAMRDGAKSVRLPASWAVANVCGSAAARAARFTTEKERGEACLDDETASLLAEACVDAATKEGDKVRANAARALGHVLAAADLSLARTRDKACVAARLQDITQALMSCLATGNAKTQWNACRAVRELFANATARESASRDAWSPSALRMCLMLVRDARHFKLRAHAAAALAAPPGREAFGNAYADVLGVVASAAERTALSTTAASTTTPSSASSGDSDALRHAPRLAARLAATLLRVAALGRADDAASVRDTLVKKRETLRRVALEARRALEEAAARRRRFSARFSDDALPEDPFGTGRSAEKKRHPAAAHDEVAVGVPRDAERLANEIGGVEAEASDSSARASSFDVSALAEALSPAKSESASAQSDPGSPRGDDARPVSEIAAAAAGLRRMYAALGGEANDAEAAFYERFARARDENLISSI